MTCTEPWLRSQKKLSALFHKGNFSDLTITFPGQGIKYKAHKVMMAMSSSIFKGMLFGPMAIKGSELELPDDNPEAFKIMLGSCYEVDMEPSDIDEALEVYMLADKYLMEQLENEYAQYIGRMLNSENVNKVLEFATQFNFDSLKATCFQALGDKLNYGHNCENYDGIDSSEIFLVLQQDRFQEFLKSGIEIKNVLFPDSWRYPNKILCEDIVMAILQNSCSNIFPGLFQFSGCVSAKVVSNICQKWIGPCMPKLYLSFNNHQQIKEVISVLSDVKFKFTEGLAIHLQCGMIPTNQLMELPVLAHFNQPAMFIVSDVDDHNIEWVVSAAHFLKPQNSKFNEICFPESNLTFSGLKTLMTLLTSVGVEYCYIEICSPDLPSYKWNEVMAWAGSNSQWMKSFRDITLFDNSENMDYW